MNVELYLKEMGQRIMERRRKLGLTQEALAELSELTTHQQVRIVENVIDECIALYNNNK